MSNKSLKKSKTSRMSMKRSGKDLLNKKVKKLIKKNFKKINLKKYFKIYKRYQTDKLYKTIKEETLILNLIVKY